MGAVASVITTSVVSAISVIGPPVVAACLEIAKLFSREPEQENPTVAAIQREIQGRKPEQENPTVTAIQRGIQGRSDGQQIAGKITDIEEEESYESSHPSPHPPHNFGRFQKVVGEYLQISMTDGHKLRPTVWPTEKEFSDAKEKFKYDPGNLHFAVTGIAGTGKSSLVNSFRGLHAYDDGAAETGANETTIEAGRYPHPDKESPLARIVWYDIPGAGTQSTPGGSEYFNSQGLFIFDFIIVVPGDRFTEQDLDILANCEMYNIPSFVIRPKADIHIQNTKKKIKGGSDHDARERYIRETRDIFKRELERAPAELNLNCNKEIFIVSDVALHGYIESLMDGKLPEDTGALIDEASLVMKILLAAQMRRYPRMYGVGWALMKFSNLKYVFPNRKEDSGTAGRATARP